MTARWLLLIFGASLAACTDFDSVPREVCGNGVLEPGEDCDSAVATCVRCAVSCGQAADCPSADHACGLDGFCHAPGGELARATAPVTFQADDLRVTDIDHDGRGDVVGVSQTSIVVRYGDAAGALTASASLVTPAQAGPASFGDLDGDGSLDVTLATVDGLVTYSSAFGALSPVDVETPILDGASGMPLDLVKTFAIGPVAFGGFVIDSGIVVMLVYDFADVDAVAFGAPCATRLGAISRADFDLAKVDVYRASPAGAPTRQFVVSFVTASGAACVMSVHGSTAAGYTLADITPAGIAPLARTPILADLDTDLDPCPGLVRSDDGAAGLRWWKGRLASGRCTLDAAGATGAPLPALESAPASAVAIGRIPLDPPIPFVSADALVLTSGVYVHVPGFAMAPVYESSRPLVHVASGDFDNDGDVDAVLAAANEDDLDLLYRYPEGLELLRFDTSGAVTSLTLGDYDGNTFVDLAYTETSTTHQRMMVSYGTSDRHLPAVPVAAFTAVSSVMPISMRDATDNLSIADDLLVIQPALDGGLPTMTFLHGSPQRTMLSFFDPRAPELRDQTVLRGTVTGDFVAGTARPDLLVIAAPDPGQLAVGMRAWPVSGGEHGLTGLPSAGIAIDGLADCREPGATGVCVQDAAYLAWPRGDGGDVVIAVDRRAPRALRLDPGQPARALPALVDGLPAGVTVRALHAADLDADGSPELIAAFGARSAGSVRVCEVDAGLVTACTEVTPAITAIAPEIEACIDAAPGRFGGGAGLVVLCRGATTSALFHVTRAAGALTAIALAHGAALTSIQVGDVTGDGVDDVVAMQGDGGGASLVVFAQCSTRELERCRGTAAAGGGP